MSCRVDSWIVNVVDIWFKCHRGTLGCPKTHDGLVPHCIGCQEGNCRYGHDPPAVEMTWDEYQQARKQRKQDYDNRRLNDG